MDMTYQVNRRKACDLCSLKKIMCDMLKPTCSNCQLYQTVCHTTTSRKRYRPSRSKSREPPTPLPATSQATTDTKNGSSQIESVELRLARIEERLEQLFATTATASAVDQSYDQQLVDLNNILVDDAGQILGQSYSPWHQPEGLLSANTSNAPVPSGSEIDVTLSESYPRLPPLREIQPAIDYYFEHVNSLIPLFSQSGFVRMLQAYYASTCQCPRAAWAAVNIVLALATRLPATPSSDLDLGSGDSQVSEYVYNAQKVLSELVTDDATLLGVQVILGMVIISHSLKDSRPAVLLVGTAVRMAQRLRLHTRQGLEMLSADEALQRNRVFWIAYLFDRDISLRHHTPFIQSDADIDVDLPEENPPDGVGNVYTNDGRIKVNFFRLRVQLAHIQGQVYNALFATRASKITLPERRARVALLHTRLEQWRRKLPSELQADAVVEHVSRTALFWLCLLHFSALGCLVMIHGIWSHDAEWRKRLPTGDSNAGGLTHTQDGSRQPPSLPNGWKNCVQMSRHCMAMIYRMPLSDCCVWANGCAYFSGLIILEANLFECPLHEKVDADLQLIEFAVTVLDRMSDASTIMAMKRMNLVAAELVRRARRVINLARQVAASGEGLPSPVTMASGREETSYISRTSQESPSGLQWNWGNDGVEAWPSMDFTVEQLEKDDIFNQSDLFELSYGIFDEGEPLGFS